MYFSNPSSELALLDINLSTSPPCTEPLEYCLGSAPEKKTKKMP